MENIIGRFCCVFAFVSLLFVGCKTEMESAVDNNPCAEVSNLEVTSGDRTVSLYWFNPNDSDYYGTRISFFPAANGVTQPIIVKGNSSDYSSTVVSGLENGTEYTFKLITLDKNQNKSNGVSIKATPIEPKDLTPPAVVKNLSAEPDDNAVVLSWTNPDDIDFSKVQITFTPEVEGIIQPVIIQGEKSKSTNTTIRGLENETEYMFTLVAVDNALNKSNGVTVKSTPKDLTSPSCVDNLTAELNDNSVILSWTNPDDADFYCAEISFTPEIEGVKQPIFVYGEPGKNSTMTINNLENSIEYCFLIYALDKKQNKSEGKEKTISITPIKEFNNFYACSDGKTVEVEWDNIDRNEYTGAYLQKTIISYEYNDDKSELTNGELIVDKNTTNVSIQIADNKTDSDFMSINIQNVDTEGRCISRGSFKIFLGNYVVIKGGWAYLNKIKDLTGSQKILIISDGISAVSSALKDSNAKIDLDLCCSNKVTSIGGGCIF